MIRKSILLCALVALTWFLVSSFHKKPAPPASAPLVEVKATPKPATPVQKTPGPPPVSNFREWLAAARSGQADLKQGIVLAETRREKLAALIRKNPAHAFAESLSWAEWAAVPNELRPYVERPFSAKIDFEALPSCPPKEAGTPNVIHPHWVVLEGESYRGYVFGRNVELTTKESLPARGFVLDGMAVIADDPFEHLEGENLRAAAGLFPKRQEMAQKASTILFGGALYDLGNSEEEADLHETLRAAEKSFNPKSLVMAMGALTAGAGSIAQNLDAAKKEIQIADSTWTETAKKTLALRISYASNPTAYSFSLTDFTNLVVGASNMIKVMSYGKTWLVPTFVTVNLPNTVDYYSANGPDSIVSDAQTALTGMGINRANYDIIIHAHPGTGGASYGYAGLGQIGAGINWLNGTVDQGVLVHEVGHNYGLGHAHFWAGLTGMGPLGRTQADGSQVEYEEYGDNTDVMGGGPLPAAHYGAHGKAALNWIEPKEVINVVTNGVYRIWRFDSKDSRTNANAKLALKVVAPGGEELWVSHRRLFTANNNLYRGAHIVRANGGADQSLVDTTPLSKPLGTYGSDRDDTGVGVGKSYTDTLGTVRITTLQSTGTTPLEYIDVEVAFIDANAAFSFYTGNDFKTNGLVGTYVNSDLRTRTQQDDWRTVFTTAGKRVDPRLTFTSDGWGVRSTVKVTGGSDANWDNFSVQWDGYILVRQPLRIATVSDDSSRMWIDLNNDNVFASSGAEFINNHWGTGQGATRGDLSGLIPPGTYRIRIQYEEGNGGNYFAISAATLPFRLFTTKDMTTPGMTGSYINKDLRSVTAQTDWRTSQTVAGTRVDEYPVFTINGWGSLASVGLTTGTDADWDAFSVQWDGFITNSVPIKLATASDDNSRFWIDLNTNGTFSASAPELVNDNWGGANGQGFTWGSISQVIQPGIYALRIQYEEGGGGNQFMLAGAPQNPADASTQLSATTFAGTGDFRTFTRRMAADFAIEFWINTTQVVGGEASADDGADLVDASAAGLARDFAVALGNGKILFTVGGAVETTVRSGFVADGQWHFVAARRIQSTGLISLFVDGVKVAEATGGNDLLDAAASITVGGAADGTRGFVGTLDTLKFWEYARADDQIIADQHTSRSGHMSDVPPTVQIAQTQTNAVQIFWDPLSSWRILEGSSAIDSGFVQLNTDQNSTNIVFGANPIRFFRVRK